MKEKPENALQAMTVCNKEIYQVYSNYFRFLQLYKSLLHQIGALFQI